MAHASWRTAVGLLTWTEERAVNCSRSIAGPKVYSSCLVRVKGAQPGVIDWMDFHRIPVGCGVYFNAKAVFHPHREIPVQPTATFRPKVLQRNELFSGYETPTLATPYTIDDREGVLKIVAYVELPVTPDRDEPIDGNADAIQNARPKQNTLKSFHGKHVRKINWLLSMPRAQFAESRSLNCRLKPTAARSSVRHNQITRAACAFRRR